MHAHQNDNGSRRTPDLDQTREKRLAPRREGVGTEKKISAENRIYGLGCPVLLSLGL